MINILLLWKQNQSVFKVKEYLKVSLQQIYHYLRSNYKKNKYYEESPLYYNTRLLYFMGILHREK